jgi:nucleotide-binding universal stress UspA family protein
MKPVKGDVCMYKTILVPVDLSHPEQGSKALGIARQIVSGQSRIVALYVAADIPTFIAGQLPEGVIQKNLATARAELSARADEAGAESEVRSGQPATVILEYAKEIAADLIIVASHRPGLEDYFLGSTAARVVRHAECPVLVDR